MKRSDALVLVLFGATACSDPVTFTTPGRTPAEAGDFVITVDGTERGFGPATIVKDADGRPTIFARINETDTEASINFPTTPTTATCSELPKAVILTTTSPLQHANTSYFQMRWLATECTILVSRVAAPDPQGFVKGVEGSFTATLLREKDEISDGREVEGPKTLKVSGTFVVAGR